MDIYENVIIGNFLFSLGIAIGLRTSGTESPPISINLLQQTPLDRTMGDCLINGGTVMRLLEFKRTKNKSTKEICKYRIIKNGLNDAKDPRLKEISLKTHWYIEHEMLNNELRTDIRPYLELEITNKKGPTFSEFIDQIVKEAFSNRPVNDSNFARYLELIARLQGKKTDGSGGSGGLIISIDKDHRVNYAVVEDLRELSLNMRDYHLFYEARLNHQKAVSLKFEKTFYDGLERKSKERSKGMER